MTELSREFSSILDLDELLKRIAASVRSLIEYDSFGIFLSMRRMICCGRGSARAMTSAWISGTFR